MNISEIAYTVAAAEADAQENPFPIAPPVVFTIDFGWFEFHVTQTVLSGFLTTLLIVGFFAVVRFFFIPRWKKQPFYKSGFRLFIEKIVSLFDKSAHEQTHQFANLTASLYLGLSSYICIATLVELLGLRPATSDLNLTFCLGIITFVLIFILGFVRNKRRRLLHFANPINWVTDAVVPVSMSIRIFANIFSGFIIMHLLYELPIPVIYPILGNVLLTLVHAAIQAFLYMYLSMSFINEAVE